MPEQQDLERSLGRLEGKMDSMVASMNHLISAFDNLEKGRLSTLEINFAKMQVEVYERTKSSSLWTSAITSVIVSVIAAILVYLITTKGII
jgi:ABC-type Fe3+ transport system permease subunit